ncbi:hypothetical protein B0H19DRAFT_1175016 [Mycena capillaripes]|nr:hypothetical protein B0H19DRAFT_1175016 [Mycena capillaripes]
MNSSPSQGTLASNYLLPRLTHRMQVGPIVPIYGQNQKGVLGLSFITDDSGIDGTLEASIVRPVKPDEEFLLYHQLWRALFRGSEPFCRCPENEKDRTARPALPVELVRLIIRTAALMVPDRQQTQRSQRSIFIRVKTRDEEPVVSRVWFWTKPLDLANTAAVQLVTLSRDQGWVSPATDVCHSWFEWGVFDERVPAQQELEAGTGAAVTGNEGAWRAEKSVQKEGKDPAPNRRVLWHLTHGNPVADPQYQQHSGPRVGMDDEMWDGAKAGSVIAVRACAQQALWENDAQYGEILVWKWFEPVVSVA